MYTEALKLAVLVAPHAALRTPVGMIEGGAVGTVAGGLGNAVLGGGGENDDSTALGRAFRGGIVGGAAGTAIGGGLRYAFPRLSAFESDRMYTPEDLEIAKYLGLVHELPKAASYTAALKLAGVPKGRFNGLKGVLSPGTERQVTMSAHLTEPPKRDSRMSSNGKSTAHELNVMDELEHNLKPDAKAQAVIDSKKRKPEGK